MYSFKLDDQLHCTTAQIDSYGLIGGRAHFNLSLHEKQISEKTIKIKNIEKAKNRKSEKAKNRKGENAKNEKAQKIQKSEKSKKQKSKQQKSKKIKKHRRAKY